MKAMRVGLAILAFMFALVLPSGTATPQKVKCATIQSGDILYQPGHYLAGQRIKPGFDIFGYNYQANMFNGSFANSYLGGDGFPPYVGDADTYRDSNPGVIEKWYWPYRDDALSMKWNNAWISNTDCDGDGKLDRHYGFPSYIGSGAWLTNHQSGTYPGEDGKECHWTYFVKIVAAPVGATKTGGIWYSASGEELGPVIWGEFITVQEVYNDPCAGFHGIQFRTPVGPGLGKW